LAHANQRLHPLPRGIVGVRGGVKQAATVLEAAGQCGLALPQDRVLLGWFGFLRVGGGREELVASTWQRSGKVQGLGFGASICKGTDLTVVHRNALRKGVGRLTVIAPLKQQETQIVEAPG